MANDELDLGFDVGKERRTEDSELVPPGQFLMEVSGFQDMPKKDGKERAWNVKLKVVDAEKTEHNAYCGAEFVDFLNFHENSRWRIAQFLDAVFGRKVEGSKIKASEIVGKRILCRIGIDKYEGKERSRTDRFMVASKFRKGVGVPSDAGGTSNGKSSSGGAQSTMQGGDDEVSI